MSKVIGWWIEVMQQQPLRAYELWQRLKLYLSQKPSISPSWIWEIDLYLAISLNREQVYKAFATSRLGEGKWDRKQWDVLATRLRPLGPTCTKLLGYSADPATKHLYRAVCSHVHWQNEWHPKVHWSPAPPMDRKISWKYVLKFFEATGNLGNLDLLLAGHHDAKEEPKILHLNQAALPDLALLSPWNPESKVLDPSIHPSPSFQSFTHLVLDLATHASFLLSQEGLCWILACWLYSSYEPDTTLVERNQNYQIHLAVHRPRSLEPHWKAKPKSFVFLNATDKLAHEARVFLKPHFDLSHFVFVTPDETKQGHWDTPIWYRAHMSKEPCISNGGIRFTEAVEPVLLQHQQITQQVAMYLHHDATWTSNDAYTVQALQQLKLGDFKCALPVPLLPVFPLRNESLLKPWNQESLSLTIVTGIFAIRRRETHHTEPKDSVKSVDQYLHHAQRLLDWPAAMIIFTEPEFARKIMEERAKRGLLNKTIVYPMCMEQSRFWPAVEKLHTHYQNGNVPAGFCKQKDSALYVWAQATKYDCLMRALRMNPWKSQSMYWVDFGIYHVAVPPEDTMMLLHQMNRAKCLRVTHLRMLNKTEILNKPLFFSKLQQAAAGGLIGGPIAQVQWLAHEFEREFAESLHHFPVLDEAILGSLCLQFPDRFAPIWSGHHEMFRLRSAGNTLQLMRTAANDKNWARVWDLAFELPSGRAKDLAESPIGKDQLVTRSDLLLSAIDLINTNLETSERKALIASLVAILQENKNIWPDKDKERLGLFVKKHNG